MEQPVIRVSNYVDVIDSYIIRILIHEIHVFKLCTGGLDQTKVQLDKVYSIYTHEVHLSTILIHFILSSLCL